MGPRAPRCFFCGAALAANDKVKEKMRSKWTNRIGTAHEKEAPAHLVSRFLGGPPLAVLMRLALLSIVVGFILSAAGLDPLNILHSIEKLARQVWDMGFDAIRSVWRYFLLGAVLVMPVWLLVRLARGATGSGWR
jgi:hypothetical protein